MSNDELKQVKALLDQAYPTKGDGCWSWEFIEAVADNDEKAMKVKNSEHVLWALKQLNLNQPHFSI